jgi:glutamate dehydrogenase
MDSGVTDPIAPTAEAILARVAQGGFPGFQLNGAVSGSARSFLTQVCADAEPDDLRAISVADLATIAHDFWAFGDQREAGVQTVRVRALTGEGGRALERMALEIIGPDMQFLVDSVMGEVSAQGLNVRAMFHPIVAVARDKNGRRHDGKGAQTTAESMIQVHLAPLSQTKVESLTKGVAEVLADVRQANADFAAMKARMNACAAELERARTNATTEEASEGVAFLRWLEADHFTFLGCRDYQFARDKDGQFLPEEPIVLAETGLGLLRDPDRFVLRRGSEPSMITPQIQRFLTEPTPIVVAKSNLVNRVHRRVYADYVGMKRYGSNGEVIGETRFVGLFTAEAYNQSVREVPMLRRKTKRVLERAGKSAESHSGKALTNIVENFPRDELFQISEDELYETGLGILHLFDRPRPKAFIRRDRFDRFVSVMVFVPKDRFNTTTRAAIGQHLVNHYNGRLSAFYPEFGDAPLARIHFIIGGIERGKPDPDPAVLDAEIADLTRTWEDAFEERLRDAPAEAVNVAETGALYAKGFSAAYRERFDAGEAYVDVGEIAKFVPGESVRVRAFSKPGGAPDSLACKIYARGEPLKLSDCLPVLENMGLFVDSEFTYALRATGGDMVHIHAIDMRARDGRPIEYSAVESSFEEAFAAIWTGRAESDGFNRLILKLGISWREAALVRALARYRQQIGLDPSQALQEQALADHPDIVRQVLALFRVRFAPDLPEPVAERKVWAQKIEAQIEEGLNAVVSLDADRALRRIARLVGGILRTNFYQKAADGQPKPYISFKIASRELEDLPAPKPYREIWVSSPEVEGVHLRFGPVARGGLRWSDRRDDFRTEVLDLVKAQQVKNAIIVPVGAKGGFFPKRLPARGAPGFQEAGVAAYKTFLRGLLDITDNIKADQVTPPKDVVRWEQDDPYLVVAADKGTATFSDIANGISEEYGHWLGDAFASGGSVGYDHKGMGITAKGAWEAVKRHFREIGKDIQTQDFTVIGVGDMSGDVFGNGMLLSRKIKLIAAFDHRDIFIDPTPDPETSWIERKRMFDLPRSSWRDYNAGLISQGGGIFSRADKSISMSPEMRDMTGLRKDVVTPSELLAGLLTAPCELLWFGGIGTFIKAASENNSEVGDKTNDAHRVNAEDLKAKVIGEGANLGVTQQGRIAFSRKGGRINTDAVDNSAGVDTSDHEVNIKILLAAAERSGAMKPEERVPLLAAMTDAVGALVLQDNYDQTRALTLAEASAPEDLDASERFMERLERAGKLSRAVEGLPAPDEIRSLREQNLGLARPELAKLLAYAKIDLFDAIVSSATPGDPHFEAALQAYFPPQLAAYREPMKRHRLRREIIATGLADDIINMGGPTFVDRIRETARCEAPDIARAFEAGRQIYRFEALSDEIDALDTKAPAALQTRLHQEMGAALRRVTIYLVRHGKLNDRGIGAAIGQYMPAVDAQRAAIWETMTGQERQRAEARAQGYSAEGAPDGLARSVAALAPMVAALDVADLGTRTHWPILPAARVFRAVGAAFGIDRLRGAALAFKLAQHWDRLALRRTLEELYEDQRLLAEACVKALGGAPDPSRADAAWADGAVKSWLSKIEPHASSVLATIAELEGAGTWTFAKTILAAAEIRGLSTSVQS